MTSTFADAGPEGSHEPADVSVVIPTHDRPALVQRAIRSAATQEPPPREIIVVSDGPDARSAAVIAAAAPVPCRYIELPERRGAPAARNAGIAAAVGTWIALLDDDDEWLPGKLADQLAQAKAGPCPEPIMSCAVEIRGASAGYVLPRRSPDPDEPVSDWLFVRHGLFHGEGFVQTSTLLARRALFQAIPFDETLGRLQDTDWLLRAIASGACLLPLPAVRAVWHVDRGRRRISDSDDWRGTLRWAHERRELFTPRAYAALLMSIIADMAAGGDRRGFSTILGEARRHGRPGWIDYLTYLRIWALPPRMRRSLAGLALRWRRPARSARPDHDGSA
jgi:glycosyltransferase involved in cell wall biosynthesis